MTFVGGYAGYNNLPIFGYVSDSTTMGDKVLYNSLVRINGPIDVFGNPQLYFQPRTMINST